MFSVAPESAGRVFRESDCKVNASFSFHQIFVPFLTLFFYLASFSHPPGGFACTEGPLARALPPKSECKVTTFIRYIQMFSTKNNRKTKEKSHKKDVWLNLSNHKALINYQFTLTLSLQTKLIIFEKKILNVQQ